MATELIKKTPDPKPGRGQPTKYRTEFCDEIVAFCKTGASICEFAAEIGVDRSTITEWGEKHAEFSTAIARAKVAAAAFIRREIRENLSNREYNGNVALQLLRVYDPEVNSVLSTNRNELTGAGGKPLLEAREAAAIEIAQAIIIARQGLTGVKHPKEIEG